MYFLYFRLTLPLFTMYYYLNIFITYTANLLLTFILLINNHIKFLWKLYNEKYIIYFITAMYLAGLCAELHGGLQLLLTCIFKGKFSSFTLQKVWTWLHFYQQAFNTSGTEQSYKVYHKHVYKYKNVTKFLEANFDSFNLKLCNNLSE